MSIFQQQISTGFVSVQNFEGSLAQFLLSRILTDSKPSRRVDFVHGHETSQTENRLEPFYNLPTKYYIELSTLLWPLIHIAVLSSNIYDFHKQFWGYFQEYYAYCELSYKLRNIKMSYPTVANYISPRPR